MKTYGKATLYEFCPELCCLECVSLGRKRRHFCCCQSTRALIMTQWPKLFPGSLKALERWVVCLSSVTLPFPSLKHTDSAPPASCPTGTELWSFFGINTPIYFIEKGVRWTDVRPFFFTVLRERENFTLWQLKCRMHLYIFFKDVLFKLLCYSEEFIILQNPGSSTLQEANGKKCSSEWSVYKECI